MKSIVPLLALALFTSAVFADTASVARAHSEAFARAMNGRDVDAALALYAEDARVVWPGLGEEAHGKDAIRALIEATLKSFPQDSRLDLKSQQAVALGDGHIATVSHWEQTYAKADGGRVTVQVRATEVIRVLQGGTLYVVDHASFGRPTGQARMAETAAATSTRKYTFVECDKYQRSVSDHAVVPGDVAGHRYAIRVWRHNYSTSDPEYGEAETTIFQVADDVLGTGTNFGTAVDKLKNGESIFWQFRATHRVDPKDGASTFEGTGVIVGGTGKYKNAKGREVFRGRAGAAGCRTEGEAEWDY